MRAENAAPLSPAMETMPATTTAPFMHRLSADVGAAFIAIIAQRDEAADGWERCQAMLRLALETAAERQARIDALLPACEAALSHLEGPACLEVPDELRAVEALIARLRAAVGEARA